MAESLFEFGNQTFELSGWFVLSGMFLAMAYLSWRAYKNGKKERDKMFAIKDGVSPFGIVISGTIGCLRAIISFVLMIFFVFLAIDAILWNSAFLSALLAQIP